jgi:hypothetical protein
MAALRFSVFGRMVDIERRNGEWAVYAVGREGTRVPAGFVIPDFIEEDELAQFLEDLFHEQASPTSGDVRRLR